MIQYIVILGAIVQLSGNLFYIKEAIYGNTRPNRITWLMWSIAPLIGSAAAFAAGARWIVLPVFMAGFGPFLVFLSSYANSKAYWKLGKLDYLCGFCSALALILWGLTKEPLVAILFAIIGDAFAAIPTLIKCWRNPETESVVSYTTSLFNSLTSFFALKTFTFSEIAFPIYLVIITTLLSMAVYIGRYKKYILNKKLV